jgi:hypothetical protein
VLGLGVTGVAIASEVYVVHAYKLRKYVCC